MLDLRAYIDAYTQERPASPRSYGFLAGRLLESLERAAAPTCVEQRRAWSCTSPLTNGPRSSSRSHSYGLPTLGTETPPPATPLQQLARSLDDPDDAASTLLDQARRLGHDQLYIGSDPRLVETLTYGYAALATMPLP